MQNKKSTFQTIDLTYIAMFAALMAVGANVTGAISIGTIPLTMQTFFAVLAGALLGSRLGAFSMILYMVIGLIGIPVFSKFGGGPGYILHPTFGFVLSFIFVAYLTGKIIEIRSNPGYPSFIAACFSGLIVNYVVGTTLLYGALNFWTNSSSGISYAAAWASMFPFLPKDILFTVVAAVISPRIYRAVRKTTYHTTQIDNVGS